MDSLQHPKDGGPHAEEPLTVKSNLAGAMPLALGEATAHGDTAALERHVSEAFDLLSGSVFGYVIAIVQDADEAEDVTQEAFLRYFCELRQARAVREPRAWIFRVAHNLALNRQRDTRKFVRIADAPCHSVEAPGTPVQLKLEEKERRESVRRALDALSSQERRCIELRAEGLRYREIAAALDIRISSVSNYVERAIEKIAGALGL